MAEGAAPMPRQRAQGPMTRQQRAPLGGERA